MLKKISPNLLSIIVILVVVAAAFQVLIAPSFTMKWDMLDQFLPCRYFISECLHHHIFPLWCPYINFGYPFYADPQSGLFYPVTWLIALTSGYNVYTIGLEYVLHVCIAAIAFFYLLRSFNLDHYTAIVFGIVYCMSGVFIGNAQHLPWIITMAWMPLVMLNFKAVCDTGNWKNAMALGLFLFLSITGGYPGFFIILFYFFLFYAVIKIAVIAKAQGVSPAMRLGLFWGLALVVFILLTGGYVYSFVHSLPYIARGKPVSLHDANNIAVTPHALISLLSPFATACASFKLNTDISMANLYCGFLLFPLVFIAFVKTKMQFFHKAIFAFAVICLMAAMGNYFGVRTWLYNFLPGFNMLRHAAIFRVFTVFGLLFIAATGFGWLVNAIRNKTDRRFILGVFIVYFILLLIGFCMALFKSSTGLIILPLFNTIALANFHLQQNVYAHITAQLFFQLLLLAAFIAVLSFQRLKANVRLILLSAIVVGEIFISAQLNLSATVISDIPPGKLQARLDSLSTGFPIPSLAPIGDFTHYSDGSTLPIWYNLSFFKKTPAKDGFNSFYLQNVDDLAQSSKQDYFLKKPVVFFNDTQTRFEIKSFVPGRIIVDCETVKNDVLCLQQNYYQGWTVFVDDKESIPGHELCSMSTSVPVGKHVIRFEYYQTTVKYLFFLSMALLISVIGLLLYYRVKALLSS